MQKCPRNAILPAKLSAVRPNKATSRRPAKTIPAKISFGNAQEKTARETCGFPRDYCSPEVNRVASLRCASAVNRHSVVNPNNPAARRHQQTYQRLAPYWISQKKCRSITPSACGFSAVQPSNRNQQSLHINHPHRKKQLCRVDSRQPSAAAPRKNRCPRHRHYRRIDAENIPPKPPRNFRRNDRPQPPARRLARCPTLPGAIDCLTPEYGSGSTHGAVRTTWLCCRRASPASTTGSTFATTLEDAEEGFSPVSKTGTTAAIPTILFMSRARNGQPLRIISRVTAQLLRYPISRTYRLRYGSNFGWQNFSQNRRRWLDTYNGFTAAAFTPIRPDPHPTMRHAGASPTFHTARWYFRRARAKYSSAILRHASY